MEQISNKTLTILLIVAIVVSVIGTLISLNRLRTVGKGVTGVVDLIIGAASSIDVIDTSIDFGTCSPTAGTGCTTNSEAGGCACTGSFPDSLVIENDGNRDVILVVQSDLIASGLIGGTSPTFKFKLAENEVGSCTGVLNTVYTDFALAATDYSACTVLAYGNSADAVDLFVELFLPSDTPAATGQAILTFTGTGI